MRAGDLATAFPRVGTATAAVLAVLLSVWGLLAATRITRGEEDTGRWDLLLAGRVPITAVVARHAAVLVAVMALGGAAVSAALTASGTPVSGAVVHGAGLAVAGIFFVAAGTLAGQVFAARSAASGAAVAVLGVGLLLRMVGDGVAALSWLRWLSPFGLLALSRPFAGDRMLPLVLLAAAGAVLFAAAIALAGRRDIGGGVVVAGQGRAPRVALLGSVAAFAVRRSLRPVAAWSAGVGAYLLLIGLIAKSMTDFLAANPRFADMAGQAGFTGLDTVAGYAATLFALLAVPVGGFVAVRLAAASADEQNRRLTLLLAQPVTRIRFLAAESAAAAAGAVVVMTVAGTATWLGATMAGAPLSLGQALAGTCNGLPIVALCLGAAVLALGWAPGSVAGIGSLPATGGFLLKVIADSVHAPDWVTNLSPFTHLAAVPATTPNWTAAAVMLAVAAALGVVGAAGYRRRDLHG